MNTTWAEINERLSRFLNDVVLEGDPRFSSSLRVQSWNWAQDVFVHHTALEKVTEIVVDKGNRSCVLPEDFYLPSMLYDPSDGVFFGLSRFKHGTLRESLSDNNDWWVWGNNLYIEREVSFSEKLKLYYYAYYPKVVYVDDVVRDGVVQTPRWAEVALCHLTTAKIMMPHAVSAAMARNYNIMIDSGTPIQNSRMQQSMDHLKWYFEIIALFQPQDRGSITQL